MRVLWKMENGEYMMVQFDTEPLDTELSHITIENSLAMSYHILSVYEVKSWRMLTLNHLFGLYPPASTSEPLSYQYSTFHMAN